MLLLLLSVCLGLSSAQILQTGQCENNIQLQNQFDLEKFTGRWYSVRGSSPLQSGDCSYLDINSQVTGTNEYQVLISYVENNVQKDISGHAVAQGSIASLNLILESENIDFNILDTDYDNYALVYSCQNVGNTQRKVYIWQLTRDVSVSDDTVTSFVNQAIFQNFGLTSNDLIVTAHSEAACYVEPLNNQPVILPGQCNLNIPVENDFNITRFAGEWRLISSYYNERQSGTCNRARYTVVGNAINILNSHIVNRELLTVSGSATLASNDRSAKLIATVGTRSIDYWILDTDYDSYALAYSCENLANNQQRILSWKLSRTNTLTNEANTIIDNVINDIAVLDNSRYTNADQSNAGCFYYPVLQPNEPVILPGQCDDSIEVIPSLDLTRFEGEWRLISSYYNARQSGTCNRVRYTNRGDTLGVVNSHVVNRSLLTVTGTASYASRNYNGRLVMNVGTNPAVPFWILDTDYNSYALAYSCVNLPNNQQQISSWKLSRTNTLTVQANENIDTIINRVDALNNRYFTSIADQSDAACFYYPDLLQNEAVILPGQCDPNVAVIASLDLTRFAGEWRLISSYYNERQSGTCNRARYTVQGDALTLVNSHVVNRQLLTVSGSARFSSTIRNGKLLVTVGTSSRDFWILDTDYQSYALAYSCENLSDNRQRIFSWKLSRTNTLTNQANTNINTVINRVDALHEPYFTNANQTDSACFYYPALQPSEPVILPGQCDPSIVVVNNFNLTRFEGEWRLISTYYNERQSGACNRARYTVQGNGFSILNSHVLNRELLTVSGSATFASLTVNDAKFLVTVGTNTRDYWILDTDYDSYALAYSCENLANNQQRIFSWKLSRTNSLTAVANENINRVISRVDALYESYFNNADQSDTACFYLPPVDSSSPVIFNGQCDPNIPVISNFDVTRYLGQWNDIESYPSSFQGGTCNHAYYSRRNNVIDVVNAQVVNQAISVRQAVGRFAESEQISKLQLDFGSSNPRDYWVLATDYTSYALVYSCVNIDSQRKQVGAWKLSRTKQLTANAATIINNVMANINVLEARYFISRDHSNTGCAFNTNIQPGDQVILPGTCTTTIPSMTNFDITRFVGTWFEIQSYPIDLWSGQCSTQQYFTATTGGLSFISRSVNSRQELQEISGTASRNTGDVSGRLTISVQNADGPISVPFSILTTDYNDYALAYGCVKLNDNLKRVYSWKLSRTTQLSNAANTAIDAQISAVQDLENRYYANVDHSDSGCFYLPDIPAGQDVVFPGQCDDNIPVMSTFNLDRFLGRWRLIATYYTRRQSGTCNQLEYSRDGNTIRVQNMHVLNSELRTVSGTATQAADGSGKLSVSISSRTVDFWILATDYDNYALAYSCSNVNANQKRIFSWKLSRRTTLSSDAQSAINNIIDRVNVLNERYYENADHSTDACFYYPTVDASKPVVFPGQCDQNIPVVTNFDAARYMDTWYDVESYPSTFQYGTCNTARYTARGDDILVVNSQIVNSTLSTREAVGVFTEGNRVAKLRLSIGTENRDYWVLSTDYTSYALIYSCINVDANSKQVGTWKMSRTRQLSQSAQNAIDAVMTPIRELDQRYFISRNHTDAGCFYHREQSGSAVFFSGQCDESVQAVPNFNLTAFKGVWHEIDIYPSEMYNGECLSQEFSEGIGGALNLVQRNVRLGTLFENDAVVTSTDGSGKLTIIVPNTFGVTIPFWILSTDYNNYALVYGCVNINATERQVYSWKLSRSKQLSAESITAIQATKANISVLDSKYYTKVNQTDAACFYLPDIAPGQTVILPGQCDVNIPVVRNFDAQRYSGTWYQIEKYYQRFEGGNCTGARYTLNSNTGVVTVLNWQVVNGTLDTIQGTATINSTDRSAKLMVRLPIRSSSPDNRQYREMELFVLDTDYTSYSLAYSCVNVDANHRAIGAWKLSRARTMSAAGNTAINAYMATRQELQSAYFYPVDQSDSCREPNSATLIKNSIIVLVMLCVSLLYLS